MSCIISVEKPERPLHASQGLREMKGGKKDGSWTIWENGEGAGWGDAPHNDTAIYKKKKGTKEKSGGGG